MTEQQLQGILETAVRNQASDVHFEVGYPPVFRVLGDLVAVKGPALTPADTTSVARYVLAEEGEGERLEKINEHDTSYAIPGVSRFRANVFRQRGELGVVMRIIPFHIRSLEELQLPRVLTDIALMPRGLILVTGATGMGKSTTIAAMLQHINQSRRAHIVTIEDPIEFLFPASRSLVVQREVGSDTDSFQRALRSVLRQDPDNIMVGELRDRESVDICLKAAETGHSVVSTVHTVDARRTITRLVGLYPGDEQSSVRLRLAESLIATVSLRLIKGAQGGMIPAVEIMRTTRSIQECIKDPEKLDELEHHISQASELGCQTFDQHLYRLVREARITEATALLHASRPADLKRELSLG
ncbi:MAG: PilT/PilU family type 4a pilus ATPase [Deltaproteobacteria bacterium]|nr:PilT/PilU family type 4a pilus ATPase [Deltaproteobacteria bacterium]